MDLGAVLLLLALLLGVAMFLAAPLINGGRAQRTHESIEVSALLAERDRVITSLQELDFDHRLGKIPEEDYPDQRNDLLQKGADILRRLDALAPSASSASDPGSRIEQAAAAGSADGGHAAASLDDDKIESMLAARRAARRAKSAGFCPRCGKAVLVTDQFCPHCGKALR